MSVPDQRGLGKQVKRFLPSPVFRFFTISFNLLTRLVPFRLKYGVGMWLRRNHAPYRFLQPTDTVVQIGCARDILLSGRSRVVYLSGKVPQGKVVLVEADADNCETLRRIVSRHRIENIEIVECGAWNGPGQLRFLSSPKHPAANLFVGAQDVPEDIARGRAYESTLIEVDSIDNILRRLDVSLPSLVSITTNGAELQILAGMRQTIAQGAAFISLASTGEGFHQRMDELGYEYIARDDRGYCFRKKPPAQSHAKAA